MSKVRFYIEKRVDKKSRKIRTEDVPILLYFSFDGKRLQLYTRERINAKDWDEERQRVKPHVTGATQINAYLEALGDEVKRLYREAKTRYEIPTVQYIRENLSINKKSSRKNMYDVIDEFVAIESRAQLWKKSTATKFRTIKKHLQNFSTTKRYTVEFDSLNEAFFNRFIDYLLYDCGHVNSYVAKNIGNLTWFLNWARKRGYNKNLYYLDFKLPKRKMQNGSVNIIALTWEELIHLYQLEIKPVALDHIRDIFCFSCFTSLRYSDLYNLKKSNIQGDYIIFDTIKTGDTLAIPLNEFSKALLAKYKDFPGEKVFPVISNQKMNKRLKELGKLAGLEDSVNIVHYRGIERIEKTCEKWELISTHVGRRTFITNAIRLGIPSEVIQAITGHKDHKVMERYLKIENPHKAEEMSKFNKSYMKKAE